MSFLHAPTESIRKTREKSGNISGKCGRKIQLVGAGLLIFGLIGTVAAAIAYAVTEKDFSFLRFLGILVGGGSVAFLNSLFLNGFGLIVEYCEEQLYPDEEEEEEEED